LLKTGASRKILVSSTTAGEKMAAEARASARAAGLLRSLRPLRVSADGCRDEDPRKFEKRRASIFEKRRTSIEEQRLTMAFSAFPVRRLWKICGPQNEAAMAAAIADSEVPAQSGRRGSISKAILVRAAAGFAAADFFRLHQSFGIDRTRVSR
jgi:hypothetical protein